MKSSIIGVCAVIVLRSSLMVEYPLYVICASAPLASLVVLVGLTYSFLSIRVNVSHLCRRRLGYSFGGMYPLCVLTVCHSFNLVRDAVTVPVCFCVFMILYVSFVITTINQIKEHLHIRAFHVTAKTE